MKAKLEEERLSLDSRRLDMELDDRKQSWERQAKLDEAKLSLEDKKLQMEAEWRREDRDAEKQKQKLEIAKLVLEKDVDLDKFERLMGMLNK